VGIRLDKFEELNKRYTYLGLGHSIPITRHFQRNHWTTCPLYQWRGTTKIAWGKRRRLQKYSRCNVRFLEEGGIGESWL